MDLFRNGDAGDCDQLAVAALKAPDERPVHPDPSQSPFAKRGESWFDGLILAYWAAL
jgi:hypothetical protein